MLRRSLTRRYLKGQIVTTTNATPRFTGLAAIGALMALALAILACGAEMRIADRRLLEEIPLDRPNSNISKWVIK